LAYLVGLCVAARPLVIAARRRLPSSYPTWSVLAGCGWLAGSLVALAWVLVSASTGTDVVGGLRALVVPFAVGFAVQVLFGALSYLAPVDLGGGADAVTRANRRLARAGRLRIAVTYGGMLLTALPVPGRGDMVGTTDGS